MKKLFKYLLVFFLLLSLTILFDIHIKGNFYQIDKNVYRSGTLNKFNLEYYIKKYHIKTILNLRGKSNEEWYKVESNLGKKYTIKIINYPLSSQSFYDFNKTSKIVKLLKKIKKPLLIHCNGGADRTSLVSALYTFTVKHQPKEIAKKELSWFYGHLPGIRKGVENMDKSFENYVNKFLEVPQDLTPRKP